MLRKRSWALLLLFLLTVLGLFFCRGSVLETIGKALLVQDDVTEPADLIVVVRGGANFERLLEAFKLYEAGKGRKVCVAKALKDRGSQILGAQGIQWPTEQQEYEIILQQLGVRQEDILLDRQSARGGTFGEALRIGRLASGLSNVKSIIVVTSWWHTRR